VGGLSDTRPAIVVRSRGAARLGPQTIALSGRKSAWSSDKRS